MREISKIGEIGAVGVNFRPIRERGGGKGGAEEEGREKGRGSVYSKPLLYVLITLIVFCISIRIKREEVRSVESLAASRGVRAFGSLYSGSPPRSSCVCAVRAEGECAHTSRNARP